MEVIYDLHDRCCFINFRRLLKSNNGAIEEPRTGMALDEDSDLHSTVYTVSKSFKAPKVALILSKSVQLSLIVLQTVHEIVQAMNAWMSALHIIRPHSYEGELSPEIVLCFTVKFQRLC